MSDELGPAARERLRTRAGAAIVVAVSTAMAVCGGWALARGSGAFIVAMFAAMVLNLLVFLPKGVGLSLGEDRFLTGRTITGRRTVDLDRLVTVKRVLLPGRGFRLRWLELVDADGVRLVLNEKAAPWEIRQVLANHTEGLPYLVRGITYLLVMLCIALPTSVALLTYLLVA